MALKAGRAVVLKHHGGDPTQHRSSEVALCHFQRDSSLPSLLLCDGDAKFWRAWHQNASSSSCWCVCVCVCVQALPSKHTHSLYKHKWLEINSDDRRVTVCNIASGKDQSKEVIHNPKPETQQSQAKQKSKPKCSNAFKSMISAVCLL